MKKTLLAYILSCTEEIEDNFELGDKIRQLHEALYQESERTNDFLIVTLLTYTIIYDNDYQLGAEIRNIYNELKYFFDGCTNDTHTDSN